MKKSLCILCYLMLMQLAQAQNYFQSFPIAANVAFNGSQSRLECSVYDSSLQSFQFFNTPWFNDTVQILDNNFGMVSFNTWTSPDSYTDSTFGVVIYDHVISQFKPVYHDFSPSTQYSGGVSINPLGAHLFHSIGYTGIDSVYQYYYRYNILLHEWKELLYYSGLQQDILYYESNTTGLLWVTMQQDVEFWLYDPVSNNFSGGFSDCYLWYDFKDDYVILDNDCGGDPESFCFNPVQSIFTTFLGNGTGYATLETGLFHTVYTDLFTNDYYNFFYTFDQALNGFAYDTVINRPIQNLVIKDRVLAYCDKSLTPDLIFFKTYSPALHSWVADSTDADGITAISIIDGTVSWNDNSGSHMMGYTDSAGWGNYATPLQLSFHLSDLSATSGHTLIHVRNNSIGTDSVIYDFGDGVTSINNAQVLWHYYNAPGNYTVCMSDISGASVCQQVSFTICSVAGSAAASGDSICTGDSVTLSVTGYTGSVQWQSANIGSFNWTDETGPGSTSATYTAYPQYNRKFRAKVTDSICIPAFTNTLNVHVSSLSIGSAATASPDSICSGTSVRLATLASWGNFRQWQSFDGVNWVDETGPGSNSQVYYASPDTFTAYRVIVKMEVCPADTSIPVDVHVTAFPDPVTTNDTVCSGGVVNLMASGPGVIDWFDYPGSAVSIHTGNVYNPVINSTTDFYVRAKSGIISTAGPVDTLIGTTMIDTSENHGLRFSSSANAVLDWVHVYPSTGSGVVIIKLYNRFTGQMLDSASQIINSTNKTTVYCGFDLSEGWVYDLKLFGTANLVSNTNGASYPMTVPGSPVTILGFYNPYFSSGSKFLFFYDWQITEGCQSDYVQVTGVVGQVSTPQITPGGPLSFCQGDSVELFASSIAGATYQWNRNGNALPGDTMPVYVANSPGRYSVSVSADTCSATSASKRVTIPCIFKFDPEEKSSGYTNPNSFDTWIEQETGVIHLEANGLTGEFYNLAVLDNTGRAVMVDQGKLHSGSLMKKLDGSMLVPGIYLIHFESGSGRMVKRIARIR